MKNKEKLLNTAAMLNILEDLDKEKKRAESYLENVGHIMLRLDLNGKIVLLNKKGHEELGWVSGSLIGKNWFEKCVPKSERQSLKKIFMKMIGGQMRSYKEMETTIVTKTGVVRIIEWRNTLLTDASGKAYGVLRSGADITERREAEERLRHSGEECEAIVVSRTDELIEEKKRYETIFKTSKDAILIFNPALKIYLAGNPAALRMFKINSQKELIGMDPITLSPRTQQGGELSVNVQKRMVKNALKDGSVFFEWEFKEVRKQISFFAFVSLAKMTLGGKTMFHVTIRDITKQKDDEKKILNQIEKLKALDDLKDQFMNITSHELKTPLTPVLIQSELLMDGVFGKLNEKQEGSLKIIHRNMVRLGSLISDILDISKLQGGVLKIEIEKGSIKKTVDEVLENLLPALTKKGIVVKKKLQDVGNSDFDQYRIVQVLTNLIDNARKFSKKGSALTLTLNKKGENILFGVKDSGVGLSHKNQKEIFRPFVQVRPSFAMKEKGTGLGLPISKGIIEEHGGKLWANSSGRNKGTTFYFSLPIKRSVGIKNKELADKVKEDEARHEKSKNEIESESLNLSNK